MLWFCQSETQNHAKILKNSHFNVHVNRNNVEIDLRSKLQCSYFIAVFSTHKGLRTHIIRAKKNDEGWKNHPHFIVVIVNCQIYWCILRYCLSDLYPQEYWRCVLNSMYERARSFQFLHLYLHSSILILFVSFSVDVCLCVHACMLWMY